ncbi:MAG: EscU/YscU/HrcU family type III secretion system export apparatus switch protein [Fibrobacterales bacterium]
MYPQQQKRKKLPPFLAIALKHEQGEGAPPQVIASGKGLIAEQMVAIAKEEDIPIHKDDAMAEMLSELELDDYIPPELFEGVAKVLAFIYKIDRKVGMT